MAKKQQRRTKGTGTVFRRSEDKLYTAGVELPPDPKTGKRRQKRVYASTRSGVEAKLARIKNKR